MNPDPQPWFILYRTNTGGGHRDIYWPFRLSPAPPLLRLFFFLRRVSFRRAVEFIAQKDAFLRPYPLIFLSLWHDNRYIDSDLKNFKNISIYQYICRPCRDTLVVSSLQSVSWGEETFYYSLLLCSAGQYIEWVREDLSLEVPSWPFEVSSGGEGKRGPEIEFPPRKKTD